MLDFLAFLNPIVTNVTDMMLSFSLLLVLASADPQPIYGLALFIGLSSLAISSLATSLILSGLHIRVAKSPILQQLLPPPDGELRWKHLQFAYSLVFSSFNGIGFLLNLAIASSAILPQNTYSAAAFLSLALCLSFLLTALTSLHNLEGQEDFDQKARLIQQRQIPKEYAEL